ncbi:hypothetical protein CUMW_088030 [Citrus unshiu]|nr:hypothetical protein CUMW_088030 [Citrus unshiu]GAY45237.1 hypothetical protein CUMW_088030 [Citrus unshiu]GAY45238.1 hypothetical protein CUMW_088030 [Citrus unshiu]
MSSIYSPGRSPGSLRLGVGGGVSGVSRLRSSSMKKPPEPLRRAVADCLSSSAASSSPSLLHPGSPSGVVFEASRTLRDYLASPATTDMAYSVIIEHTIAERERSPAVVARCVALLKRYLLRYKPSEETLLQIDRFCLNTISECAITPNRKVSPWSRSLNQQSGASTASVNASPSLPVSSFTSGTLVKSLNYVRSLVAQHIPRRSFQPASFAGSPSASRQALPTLSSLLSRSFNSQIIPANVVESAENKDSATLSVSTLSNIEEADGMEDLDYIALDVLKWRWLDESQPSSMSTEGDRVATIQEMSSLNFLEVGAAALLLGDMEAKMKGQPWKYIGTNDMPYLDQLLQPSSATTITNSASARSHLTAVTASKRTKAGPRQIWHVSSVFSVFQIIICSVHHLLLINWLRENAPVNTFRPRARPLFQYRHYSEQQPLRLNPAEVCEVIAAVCSETSSPNVNVMTVSSRLSNNSGKPTMDVAVSVLIKLVIDMYVSMHLLAASYICRKGVKCYLFSKMVIFPIHQSWLYDIMFLLEYLKLPMLFVVYDRHVGYVLDSGTAAPLTLSMLEIEEKEESVWASSLSCLLYFVCDRGKIRRSRLNGLDIRVIKAFLETSRKNSWAEVVHCKLICMLINMLYEVPSGHSNAASSFLVDQLDLIGGIESIFIEYGLAKSREARRNLYLVLFDYVLYQINETCISTGVSEYNDDEVQPIAALLALADAPEAFYISVMLGLEGFGEFLRRSISVALSRYPNRERLNMLLENMIEKFDMIISSFTHLDKEFSNLKQTTKSYKFLESIEGATSKNGGVMKAKFSWTTLHSLLHSERIPYRQNGYIWLGDLLIAEISEEREASVWSNIKNLQHQIAYAGVHDYSASSNVPLSIWLMCGLLKSKDSTIRWGFLFVLERLLMRCKFLLDENEMQHLSGSDVGHEHGDSRLEKANAVIDIMSSALLLVVQINETDRINILKVMKSLANSCLFAVSNQMCDILFSQLCLKVCPATAMPFGDGAHQSKVLGSVDETKKVDAAERGFQQESCRRDELFEETGGRSGNNMNCPPICETASMAAQLLGGQAVVPMQLVARVPAALFYWPLIQLAGAATDNISLGVAVGSKGRGNLPGATSDIRATLLLLLIGKCTADPAAFQEEVGGEEFFRELLDDTDSRRMMTEKPEKYQHMLQNLVFKAQQSNNEKLLENLYLQMRGLLHISNDI